MLTVRSKSGNVARRLFRLRRCRYSMNGYHSVSSFLAFIANITYFCKTENMCIVGDYLHCNITSENIRF